MADPREAELLVAVMVRQSAIRGGALRVPELKHAAAGITRSSPRLYQEFTEDAELMLDALDKYRTGRAHGR